MPAVEYALLAAVGGRAVLPDDRQRTGPPGTSGARFDLPGLLLGSGGLVGLVYGCGLAATRGWTAPLVLVLFGGGALALSLFVWREARTAAPLLPLRIVLDRQRGAAYLCALLAIAGMFGAFLFLTYELQVVLSFTPLEAGLAFLPMSASTFVVATLVAPRLLPGFSGRVLMVPGFLIGATGMAVLSRLQVGAGYATGILPAEILLGLGLACVMVTASSLATSRVESGDAGMRRQFSTPPSRSAHRSASPSSTRLPHRPRRPIWPPMQQPPRPPRWCTATPPRRCVVPCS
jgi:hypothetical protein